MVSAEFFGSTRNAVDLLRAFAGEQRETLQVWTDDMTAQVKEFLAEKYLGQDMSRVADAFIHKFTTQAVSQKRALAHNQQQKRGHGMGI